jgi:hypothetical protein
MLALATLCLATAVTVPDSGVTGLLLGGSILALGVVARLMKNRKN